MSASAATPAAAGTARISVPVALGLTVLVASALHVILALQIPSPWVLPDELRYAELAKSLGDGSLPRIRDEITFEYGLLYPALLAPIWALFENVATAYSAAKVLNSVVLGLTAVPAYFLARRFVDERSALIASALSVSVPSLLYAGTLMTEVALYPAFVLALLAIAVALERPTAATQLGALGAIALASMVKVLAVTLLAGYVTAVLLYHWLDARGGKEWRDRLRTYWPTLLALIAISLMGLGLGVAFGRSPTAALGAYESISGSVDLLAMPAWMFFHIAAFDLYVAVIPFAAIVLVIVRGLRRNVDTRIRLLSAMTLAVSVPLFAAVAAYSSNPTAPQFGYATGAGANERATFVLAPLIFIGLMVWLRDRPGSQGSVVVTALVTAVIPAAIPLDRFEDNEVSIQAFALVPWVGLRAYSAGPIGILAFTLTLGALFLILARRGARDAVFVAPVVAALVAMTLIAQTVMEVSSEWARSVGIGASSGWVDRAAGDAPVSVLWYERSGSRSTPPAARHRVVWLNEFFNRSIGTVYELGSPLPFAVELPATPVRLADSRVVLDDGKPAPLGPLVLAPCFVRVEGDPIARDSVTGAVVYRVAGVVRAAVMEPRSCRAARSQ